MIWSPLWVFSWSLLKLAGMVNAIVWLCGVFCSIWAETLEASPRSANTLATSKPSVAAPSSFICASKSESEMSPLRYALSSCWISKSLVAIRLPPFCLECSVFSESRHTPVSGQKSRLGLTPTWRLTALSPQPQQSLWRLPPLHAQHARHESVSEQRSARDPP